MIISIAGVLGEGVQLIQSQMREALNVSCPNLHLGKVLSIVHVSHTPVADNHNPTGTDITRCSKPSISHSVAVA